MKRVISFSALFIVLACLTLGWVNALPILPSAKQPVILYSNQCNDDLRSMFVKAIEDSLSSIHLFIYSLTDRKIIQAFQKKSKEDVSIILIHDGSTSQKGFLELTNCERHLSDVAGIMHKKVLVVDEEKVWIGSANFTTSSLLAHDNLVAGLFSKEVAAFCLNNKSPFLKTQVGGQDVEVWLLPQGCELALERLISLINTAKKTIKVAMFTWTHPQITDAIIEAFHRGVKIEVVVDTNSGFGSSKTVVDRLFHEGIEIGLSGRSALCHHKMALIDNHTLVLGSANWTRSAFKKNEECFLILSDLTPLQTKKLQKLWHIIRCTKREYLEESALLSSFILN